MIRSSILCLFFTILLTANSFSAGSGGSGGDGGSMKSDYEKAVSYIKKAKKFEKKDKLEKIAQTLDLEFKTQTDSEPVSVYLDGQDVSKELRSEKTGEMASKIASIGVVRQALLKRQQDFAQPPGLVADGRDMGAVVFKEAAYKVFLTASAQERANRRLKQLQNQGYKGIISQILAEVEARDARDSSRKHSPLKPAKDALVIDTTELSIDEVITQVSELIQA